MTSAGGLRKHAEERLRGNIMYRDWSRGNLVKYPRTFVGYTDPRATEVLEMMNKCVAMFGVGHSFGIFEMSFPVSVCPSTLRACSRQSSLHYHERIV